MSNEATVKLKLLLQNHITTPLQKAKKQLSGNVDEMREKLSSLKSSSVTAFQGMKDEIPGVGRALDLLTNKYVLMGAAVVGLGLGLVKAGGMALDWEKGLAKINVTAGLSKQELGGLSNNLLAIGKDNVAPLEQIPDAFNKIISAGVDTNTALKALDPTLKAAKAGFTDVETVAKAGVNVMKSSGEEYNTVMDVLFVTLNKGNAEFADIANYLPKIVPIAKQAGFALYETAGAFAFLTAQGQSAEASTTLLQNAFKTLNDPAKAANFKKLGVSIYDANEKMRPLTSIVKDLSSQLSGLTDEQKAKKLKSLGLDQEAASAFAIMSQGVGELSSTIDATKNSQGAMMKAYTDSMTSTDQWAVTLNNVKYILIKIGEKFFPMIQWVGKIAKQFTDWLIPAIKTVKNILSEIAPIFLAISVGVVAYNAATIMAATVTGLVAAKTWLVVAATNAWKAAQIALNAVTPWGWVIIALTAIGSLVTWLVNKFEGWGTVWNYIKTGFINGVKLIAMVFKFSFQEIWFGVQIFWQKIKGFGEYIAELFSNIWKSIKLAFSGDFAGAKEMLTKKIVTKSEAEIKIIEQQRDANRKDFGTEAAKNAAETMKAWKDMKLTKKKTDDANADVTAGSTAGVSGDESVVTPKKDTPTDGPDKVAGTAQQIKNLTVNIDAFNKGGINTSNTNLKNMDSNQIEDWFNNSMLRMIRNLEMSY